MVQTFKILFSTICIIIVALVTSTKCGSMPLRHIRHSLSYQPSPQSLANPYLEDRLPPPPRQIPRYPDTLGVPTRGTSSRTGPERGQILHRPKSTEKKRYPKSAQSSQQHPMSDGGPIKPLILNRGKGVKYVPLPGSSGYQNQGNSQEQSNRPSVYVISGGNEEEEDEGIMGSMQTYFKSFRGRIKSAMQGLIGQDDRKLS